MVVVARATECFAAAASDICKSQTEGNALMDWLHNPTPGYQRVSAQEGILQPTKGIRLDDALLTSTLVLMALGDISIGLTTAFNSHWTLTTIVGLNSTVITPELEGIMRLTGISGFESGLAVLAFAAYRVWRWSRGLEFNGYNFTFLFGFNAIGRSIALASVARTTAPGYVILATRVTVMWCAFLLSLYTYRESWSRI